MNRIERLKNRTAMIVEILVYTEYIYKVSMRERPE